LSVTVSPKIMPVTALSIGRYLMRIVIGIQLYWRS
jgi:hypothetical protein